MLTSREPRGGIARLVADRIWCVSDATADGYETRLPSGKAQVLFSLSGTPLELHPADSRRVSGSLQVLQGPSTLPRRISRRPQVGLCGVSFRPGGAGALFGRIDGVTDRVVDLAQVWGGDGARLGERLRSAGTHAAVLDLLEAEIERRAGEVSALAALNRGLERLRTGAAVTAVAEELGLSPHVFRRLFVRNVGLTPKRYLRIERFRRALDQLSPGACLAGVAADARFSDQSHMTREVERFASMTPGRLRASVRPYVGHVRESAP